MKETERRGLEPTPREIAIIVAIRNGMVPKFRDGYDITNFERFWKQLEKELLKQGRKYAEHYVEVFYKQSCESTQSGANESKADLKTPI